MSIQISTAARCVALKEAIIEQYCRVSRFCDISGIKGSRMSNLLSGKLEISKPAYAQILEHLTISIEDLDCNVERILNDENYAYDINKVLTNMQANMKLDATPESKHKLQSANNMFARKRVIAKHEKIATNIETVTVHVTKQDPQVTEMLKQFFIAYDSADTYVRHLLADTYNAANKLKHNVSKETVNS